MKATGIVRRIDDLGRVVIPKEIRRSLRLKEGDALEIFVEDNQVIFEKYLPSTEQLAARCADYVAKMQEKEVIRGVMVSGKITTVMCTDGSAASVTLQDGDKFDVNVAICYALDKAGFRMDNPVDNF